MADGVKVKADGVKVKADDGKVKADGVKVMADGGKVKADGVKVKADGVKVMADVAKVKGVFLAQTPHFQRPSPFHPARPFGLRPALPAAALLARRLIPLTPQLS